MEDSIFLLLTKDFVKIVFFATLLATPIAYYFMSKWLEDFAYQVGISGDIFISAGLITIFLSLLWLYRASWSKFLKHRAFYLGMILVGLLALNVLMLKTELLARFGSVAAQSFDAVSLDKTAVEFIKEKPLFGVGAGYYTFKLNEVNPDLPPLLLQPVNNVYLLIAAETGLISLGFFVAFLSYLFYGLIKAFRREQDLTAKLWKSQLIIIFIFMLAVSFFHHGFWTLQQGQLLFWFLLGILVATATETKKSLTT